MPINPFSTPASYKIKYSFQKLLLIILPHVLSLIMVFWLTSFSMILSIGLIMMIITSVVYYFRLYILLSLKKSIIWFNQDSARNWTITTTANEKVPVEILPSSFISNLLIILNYIDINNSHYCVIITPDCLSPDEFRRLKVRLHKV